MWMDQHSTTGEDEQEQLSQSHKHVFVRLLRCRQMCLHWSLVVKGICHCSTHSLINAFLLFFNFSNILFLNQAFRGMLKPMRGF